MGFSRPEYWSGLPFPSPGDLPDLGIKPMSLALAGGFFTTEPPGKPDNPITQDFKVDKRLVINNFNMFFKNFNESSKRLSTFCFCDILNFLCTCG